MTKTKLNKASSSQPPALPHHQTGALHQNVQLALRSGPLPPPADLKAYETILPGAAERILSMAEKQSAHRQGLESRAIYVEGRNSLLGIMAGWFLGTLGLLVGGFSIYAGHDVAGATIGGISLASLVGTFIYGTKERRLERQFKNHVIQSRHATR